MCRRRKYLICLLLFRAPPDKCWYPWRGRCLPFAGGGGCASCVPLKTWCSNWWLRIKPFHPNVLHCESHFPTTILPSMCSSTCRLRRCVIRSPLTSSIDITGRDEASRLYTIFQSFLEYVKKNSFLTRGQQKCVGALAWNQHCLLFICESQWCFSLFTLH